MWSHVGSHEASNQPSQVAMLGSQWFKVGELGRLVVVWEVGDRMWGYKVGGSDWEGERRGGSAGEEKERKKSTEGAGLLLVRSVLLS